MMIIGTCICRLCARTSSRHGTCTLQLFHSLVSSRGMHARWSLLSLLPASLTPLDHSMWRQGCFGCARGRCYWEGMLEAHKTTKFLTIECTAISRGEKSVVIVAICFVFCSILYFYQARKSSSTRVARR
jgi:hypothetical protein